MRERLIPPGVRGATVWLAEGLPGLLSPRQDGARRTGSPNIKHGRLSTGRQSEARKVVEARKSISDRKSKAAATQAKLAAMV